MTTETSIRQLSSERLAELVTRHVINPKSDIVSVLDIGCGDGVVADFLPPNARYQGIDINDACIYEKKVSDKRIDYVNNENLASVIQKANRADCILLLDVLEHTADFVGLLQAAAAKKPQYIVVSLPNELFIYDRLRFLFGVEHPAHSLTLVGLPNGFKHQYLINISKARSLLIATLHEYNYLLSEEVYRELKPKKMLMRIPMKCLRLISNPDLWSMGSIFVFKYKP